jgi:hypothetical protein
MKDMLAHLETLRAQIAQCERLEKAARGEIKRKIFRRLAAHYMLLAAELERAISAIEKQ